MIHVLKKPFHFNDTGIYTLYLDLECIRFWTDQQVKELGKNFFGPFLLSKQCWDDCNNVFMSLQSEAATLNKLSFLEINSCFFMRCCSSYQIYPFSRESSLVIGGQSILRLHMERSSFVFCFRKPKVSVAYIFSVENF